MKLYFFICATILPVILAVTDYRNCVAKVDTVYKFPYTNLRKLNPFLRGDSDWRQFRKAGCPSNRDDGTVCPDKPAIGSGLAQLGENRFLGLTDRGPNQDCEDLVKVDPVKYKEAVGKKGKGFPVKKFAPTIVQFRVNSRTRKIIGERYVALRGSDGRPISGLSSSEFDDVPYGKDCKGKPLKLDPSGLDTKDLARIPGTDYVVIVEEYSPSVVVANYKTGVVDARHVPGSRKRALRRARYKVVGDIPDVYTFRRNNRGFEGVVVDEEGKYAIAIMQSPMLGEDSDKTENNAIIRCTYFEIKKRYGRAPRLVYERSFIIEASSPSAYVKDDIVPKDMKYSGGQYAGVNKFYALERASGQVKIFLVDFSDVTNIDETKYKGNLGLEAETNGAKTPAQLGVTAAKKTLIWESIPGVGGTDEFDGSDKQEGFVIDIKDKTKLWIIDDNEFGLEKNGNVELREISLGRSVTGATVCSPPKHPRAPKINVVPSKAIKLVNSKTLRVTDKIDAAAAENLDVNEDSKLAFVANDDSGAVDIYDASTSPVTLKKSASLGKDFEPTSTSVCKKNGKVAAAFTSKIGDGVPGVVLILDGTSSGKELQQIKNPKCFLPDYVKWSNDCTFLVAACEGEGKDVPGGVLIADYGGPNGEFRGDKFAGFEAYDGIKDHVKANGIRLVESDKPSVDFEPEYLAFDGKNAFVTLQENNGIAVVDLYEAVITEIKPIGYIDRSLPGFAIDVSDKDDKINIRNYAGVFGMPQPDAIVSYVAKDKKTYLVFANEGDAKDDEEARAEDITDPDELNRKVSSSLKELVEDKKLLGRLKFSTIMGYNNDTNTQESIFHFGTRSFAIASVTGEIIFDSGEWFARIQEALFPSIFNANGYDDEDLEASQADLVDTRSVEKGSEPESVSILTKDGISYAFIGFERPSIVVVFDISDPRNPTFVDAVQNHPVDEPIKTVFENGKQGDLDPEGLFASAKLKKLFVAGSVSSTVSTYDIQGL